MMFLICLIVYAFSLTACFAFLVKYLDSFTDFFSLWMMVWIALLPVSNTYFSVLWYIDYRGKRREQIHKVLDVSTTRR